MLVKEIVEATNGTLINGREEDVIERFTQDTRQIHSGDMYIPLIGERMDGHDFIEEAFRQGASTVISDRIVDYQDKNVILVEDTLKALGDMAAYIVKNRHVRVVGITGSVGKTSTKDMIYSVVSQKYKTLKTIGNYNNQIGLPLTILRHQDEEVMVLEMGMNHLKEISYLSHIARPDIAVITNVGSAHIGELGSRENILKAKMEIVDGMDASGILIINNDNDMLQSVDHVPCQVKRIGMHGKVDLRAENVSLSIDGSTFDIVYDQKRYVVKVGVSGVHFVYNALSAIEVGLSLGIDIEQCIAGVANFELTKNRMDIITLNGKRTLIDGTYNANVDSMKSSLDVLAQYPNRKIAVLADMLELGDYEQSMHEEVGRYVVKKGIDCLLCVGQGCCYMSEAAKCLGMKCVYHFDDNESLKVFLKDFILEEDTLLLKGSNGMKLKEVVDYLKEIYK